MGSIDIDFATLLASATLTAGTATAAHQGDNMNGFCLSFSVSNGLFTTGMYAFLQGSVDGTNYAVITDSTTTISGTGTSYLWNFDKPFFNYVRMNCTIPSGNIVGAVVIRTMGER